MAVFQRRPFAARHTPTGTPRPDAGAVYVAGSRGFTLVELLVVIGIIALLLGVLLPVLGKARVAAHSAACKAMLRQYALATEMYANDNNGVMVDAFKAMDYVEGIARYLGINDMPERIARCPGDADTAAMNRLGLLGNGVDPADPGKPWPLCRADGSTFTVLASYGCNQNAMSASRRRTSKGYGSMWVKRTRLMVAGADSTRTMLWADWQNNPDTANAVAYQAKPVAPIVTVGNATDSLAGQIGSMCFRHGGASNAAFLDGHVSELRPTVGATDDGHSLRANWPAYTGTMAEGYYPWAPRNNGGTYGGITVNGANVFATFPGLNMD